MATQDSTTKPRSCADQAQEKPRFTEAEYEAAFSKLSNIFASIEAQWDAIANVPDARMRRRHIDAIQTLAQVGGFMADHVGSDCGYYGDVFYWLEIPEAGKS